VLLAVDTSTRWMGLALYDGSQVIAEEVWQSRNNHTIELAPAVAGLLRRTEINTGSLSALAAALGPGSFTSLRIGLGLVKGIALALHLPVIGVPTLDILAASQPVQEWPLAAVLQAGRGRIAVGWYFEKGGAWCAQEEAKVTTVEELSQGIHKPTLICGELTAEERHLLARKRKNVILASPASSLRRPAFLAELAWQRWKSGQVDDPVTLSPVYLHIAEAIPG
jgi:tRNA threonylcarbamoyladenosine biosynthesis protein TsaB